MTVYRVIDALAIAAMVAMALVAVHSVVAFGDLWSAGVVLLAVALVAFAWARWAELAP